MDGRCIAEPMYANATGQDRLYLKTEEAMQAKNRNRGTESGYSDAPPQTPDRAIGRLYGKADLMQVYPVGRVIAGVRQ